jgi:hypothetical protein
LAHQQGEIRTIGMHVATHCALFARTKRRAGITCFLVPTSTSGVNGRGPVDLRHADGPPARDLGGYMGPQGRDSCAHLSQSFVHQNRTSGCSSLGQRSTVSRGREIRARANTVGTCGEPVQFPLVELERRSRCCAFSFGKLHGRWTRCPTRRSNGSLSGKVSMCITGQIDCAARRTNQIHGGIGYSRHKAFEHISIATTAATESPRAARRSRCGRWAPTCLATWGHGATLLRDGEAATATKKQPSTVGSASRFQDEGKVWPRRSIVPAFERGW